MKEFRLAPHEWRGLSRIDRKTLQYSRVMEEFYMDQHHKKLKKKNEAEAGRQKFLASLPKQSIGRR